MTGFALERFFSALFFQAGYNTALVTLGAALLGASAAAIGGYVLLRKRALVSDAISHATLPGLALAFLLTSFISEDARAPLALMAGSAISAALGLWVVGWLTRATRLSEDAAIGAVLSVFFGAGVVLMTVIQTLDTGRQAGLSGYLLGATAGMLRAEATLIAGAAALTGVLIFAARRPFTLICFDPDYAAVTGVNLRRADAVMMAMLLTVMVIGMKVAGLVLIVALAITPPVTARLWTERAGVMVGIAAALGAGAAWLGAAISASGPGLPTGPVIVLVAFGLFLISLLFAPKRGIGAGWRQRRQLQIDAFRRHGLAQMAAGEAIRDPRTSRYLRAQGWIDQNGQPTPLGAQALTSPICQKDLTP